MPLRFTIQIIPLRAPCASEIAARSLPAPPVSPRLSRALLLNLRPGTARRVPCPPLPKQVHQTARVPDALLLAHHCCPLHSSRLRQRPTPPATPSPATPNRCRSFQAESCDSATSTVDTPEATLPPPSSRPRCATSAISHLAQFHLSPSPPTTYSSTPCRLPLVPPFQKPPRDAPEHKHRASTRQA